MDFFGLGGREKSKIPPKEQGRRNIWLVGLAAVGIMLLVLSGMSGGKSAAKQEQSSNPEMPAPAARETAKSGMSLEEDQLGKKLCEMLKRVEGAGNVEVSVWLSGSTRAEYAVNTTTGRKTTQERDQSGGTRLTTEDSGSDQLVMNRSGTGGEQPVVERERASQVAGVLVVAEGARDAGVKAKLFEATRVALGIAPQKIVVLPMGGRGE